MAAACAIALLALAVTLAFTQSAHAQADTFLLGNGSTGAFTASTTSTTLNSVAPVSGAVSAGATSLTRGTVRTGTVTFASSRLVMVFQATGYTGTVTTGDQTAVNLNDGAVGRWEFARLGTYTGTTTLNFTAPLINSYASGMTQVVAVPEYTNVTVASGRTLIAQTWTGTSGGVLAFLANGTVTLGGTLSASARGFRGGAVVNHSLNYNCAELDGNTMNAQKGEGIYPAGYGVSQVARGNKTNGGGGGNCHNSGGAGGGNGGVGGQGGFDWNGVDHRAYGGAPLLFSPYTRGQFGGGGGAGEGNDFMAKAGGIGGGLVFARGATMSGSGTVTATGAGVASGLSDGAGGGGAGGTVYLRFTGAVTCNVTVAGGNGGDATSGSSPGGGGAGGVALVQGSSITCPRNVSNGLGGTTLLDGNRGSGPTTTNSPGNAGTSTANLSALVAPVSAVVAPAGASSTNDNTPTVSGTSTANATVSVYFGSVFSGTATADGSGNWTYTTIIPLADGERSVYVVPTYQGITGAQSNTRSFTVDTTAPAAPNISSPGASLTTSDSTPTVSGTAEANSAINVYGGAVLLGTTTTDGSGNWTFTPGAALADGPHSITARATDAVGNQGVASAARVITVDTTSPTVTIVSPTELQVVNDTTPDITFTISDANPGATTCSVDGAEFGACSSPFTANTPSEGAHSVSVRHSDAAGNVTTSTRNFTVDTVSPVVTVSSPTAGQSVSDTTPDIVFTATDIHAGATTCSIDGGAFNACSSPFTTPTLTQGAHSVRVRHTDTGGNVTTVTRDFIVDTVAPGVPTFTFPPADIVTSLVSGTLEGAAEPNSTITMYYLGFPVNAVTTSAGGVWQIPADVPPADGVYSLTITATDAAGNTSAPSLPRTITVDTVSPVVNISAPTSGQQINDTTPNIVFTVSDLNPGSTQCSVDGGTFSTCTSPFTTGVLGNGPHSVTVRHTDAAANVGSATIAFNIDATTPVVTISAPAAGAILADNTPDVVFSVSDDNPGATTCAIDAGAFAACSSPFTTPTLTDAAHTVTVRHTDLAGNVGSAARSFVIDTAAPAAPVITSPPGALSTNDNTPTVSGTAEANSTVTVRDGAAILGTTTAGAGGAWTFTPTISLADGAHVVTAQATDAAGNQGVASASRTITIDTAGPAAPVITTPPGALTTSDTTPTLTGTAEPNATVTIFDNESPIGTTSANGAGAWAFTPTVPWNQAAHVITAKATDAAANQSAASASRTITIDTTSPVVTISAPAEGQRVADSTPNVVFTATDANPGATTCAVDGGAFGACSSPFTTPTLTEGAHAVSVRHTDAAGNVTTATRNFIVDTTAPAAPVITVPPEDVITSFTIGTLEGTAEPNSTITLYYLGMPTGSVVTNGSGNWSFPSGDPAPDGAYTLTATATDAVGNQSAPSAPRTIIVDATSPAVTISSPTSGQYTNDTTPDAVFSVVDANPGTTSCSVDGGAFSTCSSPFTAPTLTNGVHSFTVRHADAAANVGSATVNFEVDTALPVVTITSPPPAAVLADNTPDIVFSINETHQGVTTCSVDGGAFTGCSSPFTTATLTDAAHSVTVRHTDLAGNVGSDTHSFTVDTVAPSTPAITSPPGALDTNDSTPTLIGTADANSTVTIFDGATTIGTTTASAGGAWTFTPVAALSNGLHTISVKSSDTAGNQSAPSPTRAITVDTLAPTAPAITSPAGNISTNDTTPTVSGTAEANSSVTIYDGGSSIGTAPVSGGGAWTFTPTLAFNQAAHVITARATDAASNQSVESASRTITIDTTNPIVTISSPTEGQSISDSTPQIVFSASDAQPGVTTCAVDAGAFSTCSSPFTTATLADGAHMVSVRHVDASGNSTTTIRNFIVDTATPAAPVITVPPGDIITGFNLGTMEGTAEPNSTVTIYYLGFPSAVITANGAGIWQLPAGDPAPDGAYTLTATATDAAGNQSPPSNSVTITVDATPPSVSISAPTGGQQIIDTTPDVVFAVTDANPGTSECSVDGGAFSVCSSPFTTPVLTGGLHKVTVRHTDAALNIGSAEVSFQVDSVAPIVTISSPSEGATLADNTPDLLFNVTESNPGTTQCAVDAGAFATCSSPFTTSTLTDAPHSVTVRHTDLAGNVGSAVRNFIIDTGVPAPPVITDPPGALSTSDSTPTISGTAEANSIVTVYDAAAPLGTTTTSGGGSWTFTPVTPLSEGAHAVTAKASDAAGNQSAASAIRTITIDTAAPGAPTITTPPADLTTNNTSPAIAGNAEANTLVTIYDGTNAIGTTSANGSGVWTFTPSVAFNQADHVITARATDAAGNQGPASAPRTITVDTQNPGVTVSAPTEGQFVKDATPDVVFTTTDAHPGATTCSVDGGAFGACASPFTTPSLSEGAHTVSVRHTDAAGNVTTVARNFTVDTIAPNPPAFTLPPGDLTTSTSVGTLEGTGEANSTITLYYLGFPVNTAIANGVGVWQIPSLAASPEGVYALTITATDAAGNESAPSPTLTITVDTTVPVVTISAPTSGQYTNNTTPSVAFGVAESNPGSTECSVDGGAFTSCSSPLITPALGDGTHSVTVRHTDAAGNVGSAAVSFVVDATTPVVTISAPSEGAALADNTPAIAFAVTESNAGTTECAVDAGSFSTCSSPFTTATLTDAPHSVTVRHTDLAGNVGSAVRSFSVDTAAPAAPIITNPPGALRTSDTKPTISGTAEANSSVTILDGATTVGTTIASAGGAWTFTPIGALAEGAHVITATATDAAGNLGAASASRTITIDTTPPAAPTITSPPGALATSDTTPTVSGSAEANSTVTVYSGSSPIGSTTADGAGTWSFTPSAALNQGAHVITAMATDSSGNDGAASASRTITIDTTNPNVIVSSPGEGLFVNDSTPDIVFSVIESNPGSIECSTDGAAYATCSSPFTTGTLADGPHAVSVRATDAAGNVSTVTRNFNVDTTSPLVAISYPAEQQSISDSTPSVVFTITDASSGTSECAVDAGAFGPCASPYTTGTLSEGAHSVSVRYTDNASNVTTAIRNFIVDTIAPAAPVVTFPPFDVTTDDGSAPISGTAEANSLIIGYEGATPIGSAATDGAGNWSGAADSPLTEGVHVLELTATDAAGNQSPRSAPLAITIDTTNPIVSITAPTGGQYTNDTTPDVVFSVSDTNPDVTDCSVDGGAFTACSSPLTTPALADGAHSVTVRHADDAANVGSATVQFTVDALPPVVSISTPLEGAVLGDNTPDVSFSVADDNPGVTECAVDAGSFAGCSSPFTAPTLSDAAHSVTVRHTDLAGNVGSAVRNFSIDTAVPAAPVITSPPGALSTSDTTPTISGTAEANSTVTILDGAASIGSTTASAGGAWTFTPGAALSEGAHVVSARATDASGNQGPASVTRTITIDTAAPNAPVITSPPGALVTNDTTPTIAGTAETSSTVTIFSGSSPIGTTTADGIGNWLFTPSLALNQAAHVITATATDAAGSQSAASAPRTVTVDTESAVISISTPTAGQSISDTTPDVAFSINELNPGATTCAVDAGAFSACGSPFTAPTLTQGAHTVSVRHTDAAGNVATATRNFTVDTVAPAAPVITYPPPNYITSFATGALDGTAEPNSTVTGYLYGTPVATGPADPGGEWHYFSSTPYPEGVYLVTATATDAAGNQGPHSTVLTMTIDQTSPVVSITAPSSGQRLNDTTPNIAFGVTEANPGVTDCSVDGGVFSACSSPFTSPELSDGPHTVIVRHTDAAANVGSGVINFTVDAAVPQVTISAPAEGAVLGDNTPDVSFSVADDNPGVTECAVDAGAFAGCSSPFTTSTLTDAAHSVTVRHTDLAGNVGSAVRNITIDTAAPAAPVITSPPADLSTSDTTPRIGGTAEANSIVTIYDGATAIDTTTASAGGEWTFSISTALAEGAHVLSARATDAGGNQGVASATRTITIDTVAPTAPVITTPPGALITNDTTPTLGGTAETNATVAILDDGTPIGTATADGIGNWTFTATVALGQGSHVFTARSTDAALNQGPESASRTITIDTANPTVTITAPSEGQSIGDNTPAVEFTATDTNLGATTCAVDAGAYGACSSPFTTSSLADGAHLVNVRHTDAAGNVATATRNFTVDTVAPAAPVITYPPPNYITSFATGALDGTAEPNSTVTGFLYGTPVATGPADSSGEWHYFSSTPYPEGIYLVTAAATDAAGNQGPHSTVLTVTIDQTSPVVSITAPSSGQTVSDTTPAIDFTVSEPNPGTSECSVDGGGFSACSSPFTTPGLAEGAHNVVVRHTDAAANVGSASVSFTVDDSLPEVTISAPADGASLADNTPDVNFSVADDNPGVTECAVDAGSFAACGSPFTTPALTDAAHSVTVRHTDLAGNVGSAVRAFIVDTAAPAVPSITTPPGALSTNDQMPTLSGTADPGSTVTIYDGAGAIGTTTADAGGEWTFTPDSSLSAGLHVVGATSSDTAGNESAISATRAITIDVTAPVSPSITTPPGDLVTNNTTPTLGGAAEPNSTVTIFDDSSPIGTATASGTGEWTFTASIAFNQAVHVITVKATDAAGNQGAASAARTITVDTASPAVTVTAPTEGQFINDNTPDVIFSVSDAHPGATSCSIDGGAFGACSSPFTAPLLADGAHLVSVRHIDAGGNASTTTRNFTVDTIAPAAPIILIPATDVTTSLVGNAVSGTAEPFSRVIAYVGAVPVASAFTDASGGWSGHPASPPGDGPVTFVIRAMDAAGNMGPASTPRTVIVDTTNPNVAISAPSSGQQLGDSTPDIVFEVTDANPGTTDCSVDGEAFVPCSSAYTTSNLTDGTHTVTVRHTDDAANVGAAVIDFVVDTTPPEVDFAQPTEGSSVGDNTPEIVFNVLDDDPTTTECAIDAGSFVVCVSPFTAGLLADGPHSVTVRATDSSNNAGSGVRGFNVDTGAPAAPVITDPAGALSTSDTTPTISGTAESNSTVTVHDDGASIGTAFADAAGVWSFTPSNELSEGAHSLTASAADAAGNQSAASAARTITIDTTAPSAPTITTPAGHIVTNDSTPSVSGTTEAGATVTIYDGATPIGEATANVSGTWSFTTPTELNQADHVITARTTDAAGNEGPASTSRTITIDTADPIVAITSPTAGQTLGDPTPDIVFTISDDHPGTTECSIDGGAFNPCVSPLTVPNLADGNHSAAVTHTDAGGNATTSTRDFSIDTLAPQTTLDSTPPPNADSNNPVFGFSSAESGVTFECRVDAGVFIACSSPKEYSDLDEGQHLFEVRAIDSVGNADASPASFSWTIDTIAPAPPLFVSPVDPAYTSDTTPTINGSAEANATVALTDDGTLFGTTTADGSGVWSFTPGTPLGERTYSLTANAIDSAGGTSLGSNLLRLTVDVTAPNTAFDSFPPSPDNHTDPSFDFLSNEPAVTFECSLDGGTWTACTSPESYSGLSDGEHNMRVRATDQSGNTDATPVAHDWTIDTVAPQAPTVAAPAHASILNSSAPTVSGSSEAHTTVSVYIDEALSGTANADGTGSWSLTLTDALSEGFHKVRAHAQDSAGNIGASSAVNEFTVDTTAPNGTVTVVAGTGGGAESPTYDLATTDGTAQITCSVNGGRFVPCDSPYTPPVLEPGKHTLAVRFTDSAGNVTEQIVTFGVATTVPVDATCVSATALPPAQIVVTGATISRKTLLRINVTSDRFAIARITVKQGRTVLGSQARAINAGKRQIVMRIKSLPRRKRLNTNLGVVIRSGGWNVGSSRLVVHPDGTVSVGTIAGPAGKVCIDPVTVLPAVIHVSVHARLTAGATSVPISARSDQFAASTFKVIQYGKTIGRKVYIINAGKRLATSIRLLPGQKLREGRARLTVSTFTADGVHADAIMKLTVHARSRISAAVTAFNDVPSAILRPIYPGVAHWLLPVEPLQFHPRHTF